MADEHSTTPKPPEDPPLLAKAIGLLRRVYADSVDPRAAGVIHEFHLVLVDGQIEARIEERVPAEVFGR